LSTRSLSLSASLAPGQAGDDRHREGILVPWDDPNGRTGVGPWAEPGRHGLMVRRQFASVLQAGAKVVGVYGHNVPGQPGSAPAVSRLVAWQDRPEGLWGRLYVNATALGDQLLAEIDGGARDGLSVEVTDLEFDATGHVVGGRFDFIAHVPVGAYDSARVSSLAASPLNGDPVTHAHAPALVAQPAAPAGPVLQAHVTPAASAAPVAPAAQPAPAPAAAPAAQDVAGQLATLLASLQPAPAAPVPAPVPAGTDLAQLLAGLAQLQAAAHVAAPPAGPSAAALLGAAPAAPAAPALQAQVNPLDEAARLAAQLHQSGGRDPGLFAALQDITASGLPLFQEGESRLGEKLWEGTKDTARPFVDLMTPKDLKAMIYHGWEWTQLPEMTAWDGDKTPISGNPVGLRQVPFEAQRCAGGWDVDRKYKDFGDQEFWREFFTEQVNAYRRLSNSWAGDAIVAAAVDVSVGANVPAGFGDLIPATGIPEGATQLLKAVAIGRVIMENTPRVEQGPDYVLVNPFDWLSLADLAAIDLPAFLKLLKVDPENLRPHIKVPRHRVVMGARGAMTYRELPGVNGKGSPIRVEALDVARGGVDSAVYGYVGISTERVGGVISIPLDDADGVPG
jgi:hypothetical protein